jgi:hypothetical protein
MGPNGHHVRKCSHRADRRRGPGNAHLLRTRPRKYCRDGKRATTNIRPVDHIGRPMGDLNVCAPHAEQLIPRARAKNLEISMRD